MLRSLVQLIACLVATLALSHAHAQALPFEPNLVAPTGPTAPPMPGPVVDPAPSTQAPFIRIDMGEGSNSSTIAKVIVLFAALTLLPGLLLAMTSFTRIIIVLSMVRQGVGMTQLPPNRVLVALAMFLTAFTMAPTFAEIGDKALTPWQAGELDDKAALEAAAEPLKAFMLSHTREQDLMLFLEIAREPRPTSAADVSLVSLVPAFMLSELKTAFQMGALLFLPFLVIELVVGSILMAMGMMMLPPATISLPLKILVFVAVDGWGLIVGSLARSFEHVI